MPQTEEEHLENQNLDYEDQDKSHPDAEVHDKLYFYICSEMIWWLKGRRGLFIHAML